MDTSLFALLARSFYIALIPLFLAVASTTVYLHRSATHGAVVYNKFWTWFFRFVQWLTTGIRDREWVPVHRKHHRHTDEEGDGHSPVLEGFWHIQLGNVFYYKKAIRALTLEDLKTFGMKELPDWWDKHLFKYGGLGVLFGTTALVICCYYFWGGLGVAIGLIGASIHLIGYVFVLSPSINGLCHTPHFGGYQHTNAKHTLTTFNNWLVALLTGGEGFHHSHHWHQKTARFADTWWELPADWGYWLLILPLEALGQANVLMRKRAP